MKLFKKTINKAVGIDIADRTIEIADLEKGPNGIKISALSRVLLPPGIVKAGNIVDEEKLKSAIRAGFKKATPKPIETNLIVFGIPENAVYIHTFVLGEKIENKEDIEHLIEQEIELSVPIDSEDSTYSYQKTLRGNKEEIVVFVSSKKYLKKWDKFFRSLDLRVIFDFESLAVRRSVKSVTQVNNASLVIDIGKITTNMIFFDDKGLRFSYLIKIAGDDFTNVIKERLNLKTEEAENIKKQIDLNKKNNASEAVEEELNKIVLQIEQYTDYYKKRFNEKINKVIIAGGSSKMMGLNVWLSEKLNIEVEVASSMFMKAPLEHLGALGLALRPLDKKYFNEPTMKPTKTSEKRPIKGLSSLVGGLASKEGRKGIFGEDTMRKLSGSSSSDGTSKKKSLFLIILLIGFLAIVLAFWYRGSQREQRKETDLDVVQFTQTQMIGLDLLVGVGDDAIGDDKIVGRIVDIKIDSAEDYEEALNRSRTLVSKELKEGEILWEVPLTQKSEDFPITVEWLLYDKEDLRNLSILEIEKINNGVSEYELNTVNQLLLERTSQEGVYALKVSANLSLNRLIKEQIMDIDDGALGVLNKNEVMINETETGWLNVRSGPGTSFEVLVKVNPGDIYPLISEDGEWYNIDVDDIDGWIFSTYATKLK